MSALSLSSAGLRPMSAFVVIGTVVLVVAGWVSWLTDVRAAEQPDRSRSEEGLPPAYSIADREGQTLACFVPRFDLEMSPRAMWQAHTPALMAEEIERVLGAEISAEELLELLMPDAEDGVIRVAAWELSARQANALTHWIEGGVEGELEPIEGMWLEAAPDGSRTWRLAWSPIDVLSETQREARGFDSAWTWGRHLANGIAGALRDPGQNEPRGSKERDAMRAEVWSGLIPRAWCRPLEGIASDRVLALREMLEEQGVAAWQMRLAFGRDRVYPADEHELFGSWGYMRPEDTEPLPRSGLELLCDRLLSEPEWAAVLDCSPPVYHWLADRTVRGNREDSYLGYERPAPAPVVESTLDLALQHFVRAQLEELVDEHDPALAMAIVVDVAQGEVLAVESVEKYEIDPFAPIYHVFTTGSTMKVLTMACALEEGVVEPDDWIDVGYGEYRIHYPDGRPSWRVIHEAEGAAQGTIQARDALAFSVNAGMAQICARMQDTAFRGYLASMGYGQRAGSGLGSERAGHLRGLPWKLPNTHASVSFGHEISSTVWQHAAGLATIARGGMYRQLAIVRAVEQAGLRWELPAHEGVRVFSPETTAQVRDMMRLGASRGTGRAVKESLLETTATYLGASIEEADAFLDIGSKTGTAEKVGSEICIHVELDARRNWRNRGLPATKERIATLHSVPRPHESCYTSSMVLFGSRADSERELMVFVVAEEPRGKQRFGSKVSGPTAAKILLEALAITENGQHPREELVEGFFESDVAVRNRVDEPWRREVQSW